MTIKEIIKYKQYKDFFEKENIEVKFGSGCANFTLPNSNWVCVHKQTHYLPGVDEPVVYIDSSADQAFDLKVFRRTWKQDEFIAEYVVNYCIPFLKPLSDWIKYSFEENLEMLKKSLDSRKIDYTTILPKEISLPHYNAFTGEKYRSNSPARYVFNFEFKKKKLGVGIHPGGSICLLEYDTNSEQVENWYNWNLFKTPTTPGNLCIDEAVKNFLEFESREK